MAVIQQQRWIGSHGDLAPGLHFAPDQYGPHRCWLLRPVDTYLLLLDIPSHLHLDSSYA
jgi:hypothetical protein